MEFEFLDRELWETAEVIIRYYRNQRFNVSKEKEVNRDIPYRPTILCKKRDLFIAIEVENEIKLDDSFLDFVKESTIKRLPLKIYIGVPIFTEAQTSLSLETDRKMKKYKIGLITVERNNMQFERETVNLAMLFTIPPGPKFGRYESKVKKAVEKNNTGEYIDGIRDVTEIVEDIVGKIFIKAVRKRIINVDSAEIETYDWEKRINCLSSTQWNRTPQSRIFSEDLKIDLKSFKRARIRAHHPRSQQTDRRLMNQCVERMEMGVRLLREALSIERKL